MSTLTPEGRQALDAIAARHGVAPQAVHHMLDALRAGHGRMAQFNHPAFGGAGQWMQGGMTMVSDLFDHALKARVDAVCRDLAELLAHEPGLHREGGWWPDELGTPDSAGAQNHVRYAYFAREARLAIEAGGRVTVYDTQDHRIGGFGQQQSGDSSLSFHSQHGLIDVARLPVVWRSDAAPAGDRAAPAPAPGQRPRGPQVPPSTGQASPPRAAGPTLPPESALPRGAGGSGHDVVATIERLAGLVDKGILTREEFAAKKAELLQRL